MSNVIKLERWVWYGGATLAGIAGMVNAVGFLSFDRHAITHLTGTATEIGIALAAQRTADVSHFAALVASFVFGCMLSGAILKKNTLKLGRSYGVALAIESLLLFFASALMHEHSEAREQFGTGIYVASVAIGLQNGMASTYSGTLLRTTHLTGMFTDIGVAAGHFIARTQVDWMRVKLSLLIIVSFCLGSAAGAYLFQAFEFKTLYVPAILTGGVAVLYTTYSQWRKPKEKIESGIRHSADWIKRKARRRRK